MNRRSFIATALATIASFALPSRENVYYDGPTVASGDCGTWVISGSVKLMDAGFVELLAGDMVISSARANGPHLVALSGKAYSNQVRLRITPDVGYIDKSVSFSRMG